MKFEYKYLGLASFLTWSSRRTETVHTNSDDTAEDIDIKLEDSVPFACPTTTNILNLLDHVDGVFSARNDQEPATGNLMNEERPVISLTESTLLTRDASAPLVEHEGGSCNASVVALPGSPPARILGTASEVPRFTLGELTTQYMADMLQIIEGNGEQEE